MKVINILFDSAFEKKFQKYKDRLTDKQKVLLKEKILIFKDDIFDERLKTHKLNGNLKDYYSFRISYKDRLKFKLFGNGNVFFYDIGDHDDIY